MSARRAAVAVPALLAALAATLALAAAPGPAVASGLSIAEAGRPVFPERSYVLRTPAAREIAADQVHVFENGAPVTGVELAPPGAAGAEMATVLVIDASGSMGDPGIAQAMRAARSFADRRLPGQRIGVIAFNDRRRVLLGLTAASAPIRRALSKPPALGKGTKLFDAVAAAVAMLRRSGAGAGSVVVLSDGADTGSSVSEIGATALAAQAGVRIFAVGLRSSSSDSAALRRLADSGGYASAARPDRLAPIFSRFATALASEHLVRYRSSAAAKERVRVEVRVDGVGTAHTGYRVPAGDAAGKAPGQPGSFWRSREAMLLTAGVAGLLVAVSLALLLSSRRATPAERLRAFLAPARPVDERADTDDVDRSQGPLLRLLERALERGRWWARFRERIDVAGVGISPVEVVALTIATTVGLGALLASVAPSALMVAGALSVPLAVRWQIARRLRARREEFAEQLADNLQVVASAIRAGQSMVGALAVVVKEAAEPASGEFRRIVNDERLGVPLEDAIRAVARRMANRDMEQLALVAIIQRELGGNTAEVLDRVVETIRERGRLRRMMRTLTAQGRLSRAIVTAMPGFLLVVISLLNPDYMQPLYGTTGGHVMLGVGAVMVVIGSLVIKRIVEVRV